MKTCKTLFAFLVLVCTSSVFGQRSYKQLMNDPSVSFYEVCEAADTYFETVDKDKKGSGWKGYQRWKAQHESHFYPSGDRSSVDPHFVSKSYKKILEESGSGEVKTLYPAGWVEVGPVTIDSITGHYAPGLGRIESFYVNPDNTDIMYFGSRSGGFWKTSDGGDSWEGTTDFLFASGVNAIAVSPTNSDSVLINVRNAGNGTTHGVYRSVDGGDTWTETDYNPDELGKGGLGSNFGINRIAYHPRVPDLIFIAATDGLYRSDDNLDTWLKVTNGSISDIEFHPTDDDIIYIYDYYWWGPNRNKVLRSTDQGLTFTGSAEIAGNDNNTSVQIDVSPLCEDCIYFASGNGIWKSFDAGLTFDFVSNPASGSQGFAVSDVDTSYMTYGYVDCFASDNGGASFDQVTWWGLWAAPFDGNQYIHADLREAECIDGIFYVSTDGYFAKSEDNGATWTRLCDGVGIRENYTLGASQSNHYITMVGSQDNGTSINLETGWIEFAGADGMEAIIHPLNFDWMISSYQYGGRRRTFDRGQSQTNVSPPGHSSDWVAPMAYDPNDHMTVYHFGEVVHKSGNFGNSWEDIGTPGFSGNITEAAIAENNSDIIIVSRGQDIERSMDGGVTFEDIQGSLPGYWITDIAFDPNDDNTFVVTYNRWQNDGAKVYITHDMGESWTNITENLNDMPIRGAVIDHTSESNIYLAAEIGVYTKPMDGTVWELYNTDLPNCMIYELEVVNGSNTVRAATWGRGVWEYTLKDRADYPAIVKTTITDQPTFVVPAEESEQYVTSLISYDDDVTSAYVKWSIDEPTFENTIPMENTADTTWVSETPLPDYPSGTKMFFKVFAIGEFGDTTETYKFMYTIQPFEYCESYGTMAWETGMTYVEFSDLSNETGKDAPYNSYIDMDTANVYLGLTYDLDVRVNTDGAYTTYTKAWFDWNRDGDFEDAGEEYLLGSAYDTDDGPTNLSPLSIEIPDDANLGKTTMRVTGKDFSYADSPCATGFSGEVEDYTIYIRPIIDLDYDVSVTNICLGESVDFEYTGTDIEFVNWTFTNGVSTYTSYSESGSFTPATPGIYEMTLAGDDGFLTVETTVTEIVHVHPVYEETASMTICAGETYSFGTQEITEAGEYTELFESVFGCDSTVTLTVDVTPVDVSVTPDDYELMANATEVTYQWLDCNSDWTPIDGATDQAFVPTENGDYAVQITQDGCTDTSDCYSIVVLSLEEGATLFGAKVYPNPSDGTFSIITDIAHKELLVKIYDVSGRIVFTNTFNNATQSDLKLDVAEGIYYVVLENEKSEKSTIRIFIK